MSFASLLRKSILDYKVNFKAIFGLVFWFVILPSILISILTLVTENPFFSIANQNGSELNVGVIVMAVLLGILGIALLFLQFIPMVGITSISVNKKTFIFKEALKSAKENYWLYLGFCIVMFIYLFGLFILLIIPGLIFMIYWSLGTYALFDKKHTRINEALKKSRQLVRGNWWRIFWYLVLIYAIISIVWLATSTLLPDLQREYLTSKITGEEVSLEKSIIISIISLVASILYNLLAIPILLLFFKNAYLELRDKPKKEPKLIKSEKKDFIWLSTRISAYLFILLNVIFYFIFPETFLLNLWPDLIIPYIVIFALIVSTIHLCTHKKRAFALVVFLLSLLITLGLAVGGVMVLYDNYEYQKELGFEKPLVDLVNQTLKTEEYDLKNFEISSPMNISVNFSSDKPVNLIIIEEAELKKYARNESYETFSTDINITQGFVEGIEILPGNYSLIIASSEIGTTIYSVKIKPVLNFKGGGYPTTMPDGRYLIVNESSEIPSDYHEWYTFYATNGSKVEIIFDSEDYANIYLIPESNFSDFEEGNNFYSLVNASGTRWPWHLQNYTLESEGTYYFVVVSDINPVEYKKTIITW